MERAAEGSLSQTGKHYQDDKGLPLHRVAGTPKDNRQAVFLLIEIEFFCKVYLYTFVEVIGREERPPQRDPIKKIKGGKHT